MASSFRSGVVERDFASQATTASLSEQLQPESSISPSLAFTELPPVYLLPQSLNKDDYEQTITKLKCMQAKIAESIDQGRLILSFAKGSIRAKYDLVSERFDNVSKLQTPIVSDQTSESRALSFRTTRKVEDDGENHTSSSIPQETNINDTESDTVSVTSHTSSEETLPDDRQLVGLDPTTIAVVRLQWLYDSISAECLLPLADYILLEGPWEPRKQIEVSEGAKRRRQNLSGDYAVVENDEPLHLRTAPVQNNSKKRQLLSQETTEELEAVAQRPIPEWVRKQIRYSCQRKQTQPTENEDFLDELRLIKHKRLLDGTHSEKIRNSYGKAIASIAAYPYQILHPSEVKRLPNCDEKFERLFREFQAVGSLSEADEMRNDSRLQTLEIFWKIHGVGSHGAIRLWDNGYRTIDGLRYKIWPSLEELFDDDPVERIRINQLPSPGFDREQQVGLKFYDDFLERIPRSESEKIAAVIERHLKEVTDQRAEVMLVGSFRKGKPTSGDVDIVVSHPDEHQTANLIEKLYDSLDAEGWIRAQLKISLAHTHRNQTPVFKEHKAIGGFGALDIALLVWQDIEWPTKQADLAEDPDARNPATCRRVDIIVSPWKSVGCAVLGWSGGITFERDIREYAAQELGWKFDSSGVMDRKTGKLLDIEQYQDPKTRAKTIAEAERRVIEGLKLECFDPKERLTD